jgi:hypothetical protein
MASRLFFTLFALIVTSSSTLAGEVDLGGGVKLNLPTPSGFCDITDSQNPVDKDVRMTTASMMQKNGIRLLGVAADCQQLDDWHARKHLLDDHSQYGTPIANFGKRTPPAAVHQLCQSYRASGGKVDESVISRLNESVKELGGKIQFGDSPEFLGVLGETDTTCYTGRVQKIKTEIGTEKMQLSVSAGIDVKDRFVFLNLYTPYRDSDTLNHVLEHTRATVADVESANR